ncbi:hypothetical protein PIB30_056905 [Stylosanthes scabra]|uniref:Uncharacterized protein n=1 Tax=Stylosanthes scabra TaxID=79078 RepID=A0ABU6YIS7_9FABA|nr:hypothetical protein [Stylosanthes scabra]
MGKRESAEDLKDGVDPATRPYAGSMNFRVKGMKESIREARKGHRKQEEEKESQNEGNWYRAPARLTRAFAPLRRLNEEVNHDRARPHCSVRSKKY